MGKFNDLTNYTLKERELIFKNKYKNNIKFIGKKNKIINIINCLNRNSKPNPEKLVVVEGIWQLNMVIKYNVKIKYLIICIEDIYTIEAQRLIDECVNKCGHVFAVSKKVFNTINESVNSHGLMAVCYLPLKTFKDVQLNDNSKVVILDGLEIQGNVGTIIRTADATNTDAIIFSNRKIRLNHPKLIRSSMGSSFKIPIIDSNFEEISNWLVSNGFRILITDSSADVGFYEVDYKGRIAIVIGSEKYGISNDWYSVDSTKISIPMFGDCDSLNVAIATTVVLYEAVLKQKKLR